MGEVLKLIRRKGKGNPTSINLHSSIFSPKQGGGFDLQGRSRRQATSLKRVPKAGIELAHPCGYRILSPSNRPAIFTAVPDGCKVSSFDKFSAKAYTSGKAGGLENPGPLKAVETLARFILSAGSHAAYVTPAGFKPGSSPSFGRNLKRHWIRTQKQSNTNDDINDREEIIMTTNNFHTAIIDRR